MCISLPLSIYIYTHTYTQYLYTVYALHRFNNNSY